MAASAASHLSWLLRIQEAENLLGARSTELGNRTAIARGLEQELQQHAGLKDALVEQLLEADAWHAQLKLEVLRGQRRVQEQQGPQACSEETSRWGAA
jgi:hypothetical protein